MSAAPRTFRDLIAENRRRSLVLVVLFCVLTATTAVILGLAVAEIVDPGSITRLSWAEALFAAAAAGGLALLLSWLAYARGDQLVLAISHAQPITHTDDPVLFNVVEEMAIAAGAPLPRVYLIDDTAPNAFATGRDPTHAVIVVTRGLRTKLSRDELQGVVAHEMSHIRNYDTRLMLLMAVLVGTVVMIADFLWQALRFSGLRSRRRDRDEQQGGALLFVIILVVAIAVGVLAPLLARVIQFAVSREREYLADASAVELTRYPQGLANALRKIDADPDVLEVANRGTAHLYIANPIKQFEARASTVFASHPPIGERIRRLEALVGAGYCAGHAVVMR